MILALHRRTGLLRWLTPLPPALALAGCPTTITALDGSSLGGSTSTGAGGVAACSYDPGGEIFSDLAEADTDELSPGRPAVAAGADGRYLVVTPQIRDAYKASAVLGALVTKDRAVTQRFTIADELGTGIGVDAVFDGSSYLVVYTGGAEVTAGDRVLRVVRVSQDGALLGPPIDVASDVVQSEVELAAPVLAHGGGTNLVVYMRFDGYDLRVYGRWISQAGDISAELPINAAKGGQSAPALDFDGTNFLVVWQDGRNKASFDDDDIYAARLAPGGAVLDPDGIAIATGPTAQRTPHVAFDGTRHVVAWFEAGDSSLFGDGNIRGARLDTNGALLDGPSSASGFPVNTSPNMKDHPRVLALGFGAMVAWGTPGYANNGGAGIFGEHLGADGLPLHDAPGPVGFPLAAAPEDFARHLFPVGAAAGDRALLVWLDNVELGGKTKSVRGAALCPW